METANLTRTSQAPALTGIGELILQNGRQAGTRRPLGVPTTFIGRNQGCDIRLNIEGVDAIHCVLIYGPDGLLARDLNSAHGTYVNGERVSSLPIRHGDSLKVGPFQFRVEMSATAILEVRDPANCSLDAAPEAMRVMVASVAAQQIALEDEESRLLHRENDLHQQEEQLASHLAEKQRQVQMWSEHTKTERETLRKQRTEQQQVLTQWEQELTQAKEHLGEEQHRLILERQRISKVYQRLRQRWQRQWSAEKQKHQQWTAKLQAEGKNLDARQQALRDQEAALNQEALRFNTERALGSRQLQENWEELKKNQISWRRRQAHERALAKARQQQIEELTVKMNEARQLLQQERETWQRQQESLQKELHGLNNRIVHQRQLIKTQDDKVAALDQELRTRLLHLQRVADIETGSSKALTAETSQSPENESTERALVVITPRFDSADLDRCDALDRLTSELADQRVHLVEQYRRMAEVEALWALQREQAVEELEVLGQKLQQREEAIVQREQQAAGTEKNLLQERDEVQALRQEIQSWRTRLRAREQTVELENQKRLQSFKQQELLLQEQLSGLTYLRQRWNRRRQEEVEHLRKEHAQIKQQREEVQQVRQELFARGQAIEEEKRILAEKTLAVELYRQEAAGRANDPTAQRRIERLRRRWVMQHAAQIRHATRERETVRGELVNLQSSLEEWASQMDQLTQANAIIAEHQLALEEREALLKARELKLEQELRQSESQRQITEEKYLRIKEELERMAKAVYEESDSPDWPIDKAA